MEFFGANILVQEEGGDVVNILRPSELIEIFKSTEFNEARKNVAIHYNINLEDPDIRIKIIQAQQKDINEGRTPMAVPL